MTPPQDSYRIGPGQRVRVRDVNGEWAEKITTSAVEGCRDADGRLRHDFPGVYVRRPDSPDDEPGIFWPIEDVEIA